MFFIPSRFCDWFRKPHPVLSNVADLLGVGGTLGVLAVLGILGGIFWEKLHPYIRIECPPEIRSHEHVIFGSYSPDGYRIRVYVHPIDGQEKYWLQGAASESSATKTWTQRARFGNPYGKGHVKEPPLHYDVFAVLVPESKATALPGMDEKPVLLATGDDFAKVLEGAGVKKITTCRIWRQLETCRYQPTILYPEQPVDPREYAEVRSPVLFRWKPNMPMYVELWHEGEPAQPHVRMDNDQPVPLAPGTYELKIRERKGAECDASVWFRVLQN